MRHIILVLAGVTLSSGCDRFGASPAQSSAATPAGAAIAEPATVRRPLEPFKRESDEVSISARYDPAIFEFDPALADFVEGSTMSVLADFEGTAINDHATIEDRLPTYFMSIDWKLTWNSVRVASLTRTMTFYSGGAHPNSATATLLWDAESRLPIGPEILFGSPETARRALFPSIQTALLDAKMERLEAPVTDRRFIRAEVVEAVEGYSVLPTIGFVGEEYTTPTVRTYFSPYEVGPFAEGAYELDLEGLNYTRFMVEPWRTEFTR